MIRLVLASGSPRRRDILAALGLSCEVRPPQLDEVLRPAERAADAARRLAEEKAATVAAEPAELVLAADTIVALEGELLGKPVDPKEARHMLARLAGRTHTVVTGVALRTGGRTFSLAARTRVTFRPLDADEIAAYVGTGEPLDKAGAYGIQGYGSALIARIEGDFFNVMGLPVPTLLDLLELAGYRYLSGTILPRERSARGVSAGGTS